MQINVSSNISTVAKAIDAFGKNEIPFATHRALNDTAFAVRNHIVKKTYPQSFNVKSKNFAGQAFRVQRSPSKRKLTAAVFDRMAKDYLVNQAEGGKKVKRGRYISIPATDRPKVSGPATYNRVHPRVVLDRPKSFVQSVNGQPMILERRTKKRYPLKRLYILHDQDVTIPKRFPFYEEARKRVQKDFDKFFANRFAQAKRSPRRR